jgi:paraquat-inducible protein A
LTPHLGPDTVACPDCGLQQKIPPLAPGAQAHCARCRVVVARNPIDPIDRPLALAVAALLVFLIANTAPLLGLAAIGRESSTTILGGAHEMWLQGSEVTAVAVALCAVVAPGAYIVFMLVVLLAARKPPAPRWVGQLLHAAGLVQPWAMSEVMLLGVLVALVKLAQLASVVPGVGLVALGCLIVLLAALSSIFDPQAVWRRVAWAGDQPPAPAPRTPYPLSTTWALVIAAAILFIPANTLPVLTTTTLGDTESDTILSGVVYLYQSGSWPLALIVLVASVIIPLAKLVALGHLLICVQRGAAQHAQDRARLFRLVAFVGRWSMLDVFVDAFIVALVQFDPLMSAAPGPGVVFFMAVVVLTMLASHSFDPRLLWQPAQGKLQPHG